MIISPALFRILGLRNKGASPASTGHPRAAPGSTTLPCTRPPRLSLRRRPSGPPNDHRLDTDRIPRRAHDRMSVITERDQSCWPGPSVAEDVVGTAVSAPGWPRSLRLCRTGRQASGSPAWGSSSVAVGVRGWCRAVLPIGLTGRLPGRSGRSRCRSASLPGGRSSLSARDMPLTTLTADQQAALDNVPALRGFRRHGLYRSLDVGIGGLGHHDLRSESERNCVQGVSAGFQGSPPGR